MSPGSVDDGRARVKPAVEPDAVQADLTRGEVDGARDAGGQVEDDGAGVAGGVEIGEEVGEGQVFFGEDGAQTYALHAGMLAVIPLRTWHRFHSADGVTLITATPFPSEVIDLDVDDPRAGGRKP